GGKTHVAVHVDETRQDPALEHVVDARRAVEGEAAAHDPHPVGLALVVEQDPPAQLEDHQRKNFSNWLRSTSPGAACSCGCPRPKALPGAALPAARSCAARSCAARFAGLPDLPLRFLGAGA